MPSARRSFLSSILQEDSEAKEYAAHESSHGHASAGHEGACRSTSTGAAGASGLSTTETADGRACCLRAGTGGTGGGGRDD